MGDMNVTIQQHPPLRVPAGWGRQERSMVMQLEEILDDIYRRFGRIRLQDLNKDFRENIVELDGNMTTVKQDVSGLTTKVSTAEGNISTLQQTAAALTSDMRDAKGNISTLQQTATTLTSDMRDAKGNISTLQQTATTLTSKMTTAEGNISTLQQTATTLTSDMRDAKGNISTLQQTATTLTSKMSTAEGNISTLQQTATTLTSKMTTAEGNISTLQQTASTLSSQMSTANGNISTLQQTATTLTSKMSTAEGNISTLQQTASTLSSQMSTANGNISTLQQTASTLSATVGNKYDKVSGINITSDGVDISGDKYVKISSADNGVWEYNSEGLVYSDSHQNNILRFGLSSPWSNMTNIASVGCWADSLSGGYYTRGGVDICVRHNDLMYGNLDHTGIRITESLGVFNLSPFYVKKSGTTFDPSDLKFNLGAGVGGVKWSQIRVGTVYYDNLVQDSSRDKKHNIRPLEALGGIIDQLQPVRYVYNSDKTERDRLGLIYEDTVDLLPEICVDIDGDKGINYVELVPALLREIKDLRARVARLEAA